MANSEVAQAALDRASDENLLLIYQPIHDARTREVFSAEALLRQRRETGEIREASIITAAAEKGPELFALDSWAVRTAYRDAVHWQSHGAPDVCINVNLSPREFQEGNAHERLQSLVVGCGIDTRKINLEITETTYIKKPEQTMIVLNELKKLGVGLWLDDFGTGHSSLVHLLHFPVDGLKIAGEFVKDIAVDRRSAALTHTLITLAHDLGMKVIAEGIEREEQLNPLLEWGCDYIQGFLWGRPMPLQDFEQSILRK